MAYHPYFNPGKLEVFTGPMRSGKTREMINRIDITSYMESCPFLLLKPKIDTRDDEMKTRFGNLSFPCSFVDEKNPEEILGLIKDEHKLIAIDEVHFFSKKIIKIILKLLRENKNVLVSGLDLDFKGEVFGPMGGLIAMADEVYKQKAVCCYDGCDLPATRTQRIIDGKPAHYDSDIILVGHEENYEPRCLKHHIVPGK